MTRGGPLMEQFDPLRDRHGISGPWAGHYHYDSPTQAGRPYPIAATFWQVGGRIEGAMTDAVTDTAYGLQKVVDNAEAMGLVAAYVYKRMLRRHPGAIMEMSLPSGSVIHGRVRGDVVSFTKTYEGSYAIHLRDAGSTLGSVVRPRHRVNYSGVFDVARGLIEGTWEIRRPGPFGRFLPRLGTGTFSLARDEGSA
jgi:hypothetical protein